MITARPQKWPFMKCKGGVGYSFERALLFPGVRAASARLSHDAVGVKKILYTEDTEEEIQASVVEAKAIICNGVISSCYLHWLIP